MRPQHIFEQVKHMKIFISKKGIFAIQNIFANFQIIHGNFYVISYPFQIFPQALIQTNLFIVQPFPYI